MQTFPKIFVALSMLCYLATSSIAAVHAFPMMGSPNSSQGTSSVAQIGPAKMSVDLEANVAGTNGDAMAETMMPACHQTSDVSADSVKASNICKIFCSAIGHALLSLDSVEAISKPHHTSPQSRIIRFLSTQTSVEQQPPK